MISSLFFNQTDENVTSSINVDQQHIRPYLTTILIAFSLALIIILTVLGNILVLIALSIDFALRSPTHVLMGNLACADLLLGITVLPFSATREILGGRWPFGPILCQIWLSIDVLYCTSSIYGLMFISIERYIGVTRPLRYPLIITHRRTAFAIGLAWSVAICVSLTPFLGWKNEIQLIDESCFVNDNLSYVLFSCSASFYIPLIIIVCVYGRIYGEAVRQYRFLVGGEKQVRLKDSDKQEERVTLRVHIPQHLSASTTSLNSATMFNGGKRISTQLNNAGSSRLHKFKRERKAAKTLGIVVGMFILCWLPFFLLLPIKALTSFDPGVFFSICFWLGYCNSCFNPFIYAFSSREFRRAFQSILRCRRISSKPFLSSSVQRISTFVDQTRLQKSYSCDVTISNSVEKSETTSNCRRSCDSHKFVLTSKSTESDEKNRSNSFVFPGKSSTNKSKSLLTLNSVHR